MKVVRQEIKRGFTLAINTPQGVRECAATIPGVVHTDLIAAGLIRDIRIDGSEAEQEWIRSADATYRAKIAAINHAGTHELHFDGLDTLATVAINGQVKLTTENMHRAYSVDITDVAHQEIDLEVSFAAPLPEALRREQEWGAYPNPYDMPYNYFRKMACSFGWDWGPITGTSGIWKPIHLVSWTTGILDEVGIIADVVDGIPQLRVRTTGRGSATDIWVRISDHGDEAVFTSSLGSDDRFLCEGFALWQPRGFGEPTLYTVEVHLLDNTGAVIDEVSKRVGFRNVRIDQSNHGDRQNFSIIVNDHRVWAKGVNWIPDDPFPHRITKAQYEEKIADLYAVEVSAIRVWGGGIYESDDFYNACDERGIIVWQDFLFACAAYPESEKAFAEIAQEAREAITRLGSHPSLVMWCGGNECIEGFQHWGWQEKLAGRDWGLSYYLRILPSALAAFDGSRPYIPGSPFSTLTEDVKDFASGTNHIWDVWNEVGYQRYEEYAPSFAAEFGYNGPAAWTTLTKAVGKKDLDSQDPELATHQKAFFGMDKLAQGLKREFSKDLSQGAAWYFAAQLVQARAVEVGLKHFRSQYETCSGTMLWQYNDMWPAISWSVLDSASARKLSWFAMREAYRPRLLHFSGADRELIAINDSDEEWHSLLRLFVIDQDGAQIESRVREISMAPRSQIRIGIEEEFLPNEVLAIDGFLIAQMDDIRVARRMSNNPIQGICGHEVDITARVVAEQVHVHLQARSFTFELSLLPELVTKERVQVSQQLLTLLPDEEIDVVITTASAEDAEAIAISIDDIAWSVNRLMQ